MAKPKRTPRRRSDKPTDFQQRVLLHMEISARPLVLLERVAVLRDNGQLAKAQKVMKQAERLNEKLLELESQRAAAALRDGAAPTGGRP